jgi:hypothetical protein
MRVGRVLVNRRVHAPFSTSEWAALGALADPESAASPTLRAAIELAQIEMAQAAAQVQALEPLRRTDLELHEIPRFVLPEFDAAVLLDRLDAALAPLLVGSGGQATDSIARASSAPGTVTPAGDCG